MNKIIKRTLLALVLLLSLSALLIYWHEADKEIRILCTMFYEGSTSDQVTRTLNTANLLIYDTAEAPNGQITMQANSPHNLYSSECLIQFDVNEKVIYAEYIRDFNLNGALALTGSLLLILLAGGQILLSVGRPLGEYFWGGYHKVLPTHLRIGSFISSLLLVFAMLILIHQVQGVELLSSAFPFSELNIFFAILFLLSTLANANSESFKEMTLMTPIAALLYLAFLSAIFAI
jgi:hypothetical protein